MRGEYIQNLRYKLQKRIRRLHGADFQMFHFALKQFWGFLKSHPMCWGILQDLGQRCPTARDSAAEIVGGEAFAFPDELTTSAVSYFVLQRCAESDDRMLEINIGHKYKTSGTKHDEAVEYFRSVFVEPVYEYLDEQLDDQRATLALLKRYKHKCEWFQRRDLFARWETDTARGEKQLALHLYEYLHDQGLEFSIEPWSGSGEADLVAMQSGEDRLIADAKVFGPGTTKGYLARGFRQVYTYTGDYNQPVGYLVVYKTREEDLKLILTGADQFAPFVVHNNKTIFIIVVDIFPYDAPASKRGPLKAIEVTEDDLVQVSSTGEVDR